MIVHVRFIGSPSADSFLFRPTWIQPVIPELAVLFYADRRVRPNLPSPRDISSQTGESSAIWKLGRKGSEKTLNETTSWCLKGRIRRELRYLLVSRDGHRH